MMTTKRSLRLVVCGLIVGIVYLGLGASAMAWNEPLWIRQFGTKDVDIVNFGRGIATDGARNIYVTGRTGVLSWIVKYNDTGHLQWQQQVERGVIVSGVTTDVTGSVYVTGQHIDVLGLVAWLAKYTTNGTILWAQNLIPEIYSIRNITEDINNDIYITGITVDSIASVVKYNASGILLWKQLFESNSNVDPYAVTTDTKGNVYLAGSTDGAFGGTDAWVSKYDADGHSLWKRQFGTSTADFATFVAAGAAGQVYVFGVSVSDDEEPTYTYWLAKYDGAGHRYWKRQIDLSDQPVGVEIDKAGNLYLAGGTGSGDAWVAKYDPTGRQQWKRHLGTDADDFSEAVALDTRRNVYVTGETAGSLGGPSHGSYDVWVAKYSTRP